MPSLKEIANADIIAGMLTKIEDISINRVTEDIFIVTETETDNELSITLDVEDTTVIFLMNICPIDLVDKSNNKEELLMSLLRLNGISVHGAFAIIDKSLVLKDVLEIDNINQNELEAVIAHMLVTASKSLKDIYSKISLKKE